MSEHYFSEKQQSEDKRFLIDIKIRNDEFKLLSSSGIFSKDELDAATKLLIERAITGDKMLDLGCGYGVVGISLLRRNKDLQMVFSDVNERALDLTKENLHRLHLEGTVVKSDLFANLDSDFDAILTNPPHSAGRKVCYQLIEDSFSHLKKDGTLQLVARHNKGGKMLSIKMQEVFGNMETVAKNSGFHVYVSKKN